VSQALRRYSVSLVVVALIAMAGISLSRVYNGLLLLELIVGAAAASVAISTLLRRVPAAVVAAT